MIFYNGALSYTELKNMPIPEILQLSKNAGRMNTEQKKELSKSTGK
jgi:hypothetical protein